MNFDIPTPPAEKGRQILTAEEVKAKIEKLSGKENQEVIRMLEDEKGVYLYEVVAVDDKGDASLFSYRRSGNFQETKRASTGVDVAYFIGPIEDDMCVGGDTLSNYDETSGTWIDTK
ncbi:MAG: hypothetical protein PHH40_01165 [Candidatus Moranbacteria bacterium]|nr:hypothetical protein [Candidatus Moranbacteria bacterium]MDD3964922.1 hypothetical protein [Candidatus Moranbacteria bacterium]